MLALGLLPACADPGETGTAQSGSPLIYGEDQRRELYEVHEEPLRELILWSSVALMPASTLRREADGRIRAFSASSGEQYGLCPSERFSDQPGAALCSGTLIGDSLVLTAGHCTRPLACADQAWVFGYAIGAPGVGPSFGDDDIYGCKAILASAYHTDGAGRRLDYAIIELDRSVAAPRRPAPLSPELPRVGDTVSVVGYPAGVPVKVDSGASVLSERGTELDYFALNSDTYDRSSGSGVFDAHAELVGVFVRGAEDYEYRAEDECLESRRVPDSPDPAKAEQATYVAQATDGLCASGWRREPCRFKAAAESSCALRRSERESAAWWWTFLLLVTVTGRRLRRPIKEGEAI